MVLLPIKCPIYVVIDVLDEDPTTSGIPSPLERVVELVNGLVGLHLSNLCICITSRSEIDIRSAFEPLARQSVSPHDKDDIVHYIRSWFTRTKRCRRWRDEDNNGFMPSYRFRWVFCQLDVLRYCFPPSVGVFPESLDET